MKPIIGVTPDYNGGERTDMGGKEPTYFLRARYLEAIESVGGLPLILPLVPDVSRQRLLLANLDGLLVTGSGSDLAPELYGERQRFRFTRMTQQRSSLELGIAKLAHQSGIPTLGICGGMQSMNVALGGNLIQDIASQLPSAIPHQPTFSAEKPAHVIQVASRTLLRRIARMTTIPVNSSHHQSVKKVAPSLLTSAVAPDGVIEAIESTSHPFYLGVQWHPEFLYSKIRFKNAYFKLLFEPQKNSLRILENRTPASLKSSGFLQDCLVFLTFGCAYPVDGGDSFGGSLSGVGGVGGVGGAGGGAELADSGFGSGLASGLASDGAPDAASGFASGLGVAGFGFGGGLGFSGLIPPSQWGPEYISAASPFSFHFASKSAAALLGFSPVPIVRFQG